jgi:iron complex outermembrane receptor protein
MAREEEVPCFTLDPVVVTGSRIPEHLSRIAHSVSIIGREEIEALPVDNIPDLLETVSGVDVRQRGAHGVQADVVIRGGSFQQTLVLIDGVNVSDSQTGHHNMDLPVNLEDIERIEVLKGPGARVYGNNAMSGVINIITREIDRSLVGGFAKYGDYDYRSLGAHGVLRIGDMSNRVTVSRRSSTGHIEHEDTDFDINTLVYKGSIDRENQTLTLSLGYTDKDFGAYGFYSDTFPRERERTETLLAYSSAHLRMVDLQVVPKVFWRHHDDDFKIDVSGNWFRNEHQTDSYGVQLDNRLESALGTTAVGGEITFETLESSNLGDHRRRHSGVFFEHKFYPVEWLTFGLGASAMYYSDWGWEYWPGAECNVELSEGVNWFASSGKSFRIPTYTEMFYYTPANQGNRNLEPERAWTYETGIWWNKKGFGANFSTFLRDEEDIIDWSRVSDLDPWKARNIAQIETQGFELGLNFYPETLFGTPVVSAVNLAYTYLDLDLDSGGLDSKYVLDHLRHQVHGSIILYWHGLTHAITTRYEERIVGDSHVVVDTRLAYKWGQYEVFLEVTNVLDEQYIESGFAPLPGRWIIGGIRLNEF